MARANPSWIATGAWIVGFAAVGTGTYFGVRYLQRQQALRSLPAVSEVPLEERAALYDSLTRDRNARLLFAARATLYSAGLGDAPLTGPDSAAWQGLLRGFAGTLPGGTLDPVAAVRRVGARVRQRPTGTWRLLPIALPGAVVDAINAATAAASPGFPPLNVRRV